MHKDRKKIYKIRQNVKEHQYCYSSPFILDRIVRTNIVIRVKTRELMTISSILGISNPVREKTRRSCTLKHRKNATNIIIISRVDSTALLVFIPRNAETENIAITAASRIIDIINIFIRFCNKISPFIVTPHRRL